MSALRCPRDLQLDVAYLLGTPLLSDCLEEGQSQFGLSCEDIELAQL